MRHSSRKTRSQSRKKLRTHHTATLVKILGHSKVTSRKKTAASFHREFTGLPSPKFRSSPTIEGLRSQETIRDAFLKTKFCSTKGSVAPKCFQRSCLSSLATKLSEQQRRCTKDQLARRIAILVRKAPKTRQIRRASSPKRTIKGVAFSS